jgi:hypothetical protein
MESRALKRMKERKILGGLKQIPVHQVVVNPLHQNASKISFRHKNPQLKRLDCDHAQTVR